MQFIIHRHHGFSTVKNGTLQIAECLVFFGILYEARISQHQINIVIPVNFLFIGVKGSDYNYYRFIMETPPNISVFSIEKSGMI